jgi:hypothetical protein
VNQLRFLGEFMTEKQEWAGSTSNGLVAADNEKKWECIIDHEDDIDWDNIIATTEDDFKAGRYAFNSADYATHEEAMAAMRALIHSIAKGVVERNAASNPTLDAVG